MEAGTGKGSDGTFPGHRSAGGELAGAAGRGRIELPGSLDRRKSHRSVGSGEPERSYQAPRESWSISCLGWSGRAIELSPTTVAHLHLHVQRLSLFSRYLGRSRGVSIMKSDEVLQRSLRPRPAFEATRKTV